MAVKRGGLGRGLDSLIPKKTDSGKKNQPEEKAEVQKKAVEKKAETSEKKTASKKADTKKSEPAEKKHKKAEIVEEKEQVTPAISGEKLSDRKKKSSKKKEVESSREQVDIITNHVNSDVTRKAVEEPKSAEKAEPDMEDSFAETDASVEAESYVEVEAPVQAESHVEAEAPVKAEAPVIAKAPVKAEPSVAAKAPVAAEAPVEKEIPVPEAPKDSLLFSSSDSVREVPISQVEPNREQPRKQFREEAILELAASVAQHGVIQPLLVQKKDDYYEIIAGERRWRAARKAGLRTIPVIIRDYSEQEVVEVSLIENLQREDLNPIEEAMAYERLLKDFSLTQEEIASRVSKSRSTVTNSLRLLRLSSKVRGMVISGELTEGHARALLGLPLSEMQEALADEITSKKLSVRETERAVRGLLHASDRPKKGRDYQREAVLSNISERLKSVLGTRVQVKENAKERGRIEIEYYSGEELERIYELLTSIHLV